MKKTGTTDFTDCTDFLSVQSVKSVVPKRLQGETLKFRYYELETFERSSG